MPAIPFDPDLGLRGIFLSIMRLWLEPSSLEATNHLISGWNGATLQAVLHHVGAEQVTLTREEFGLIAAATPGRLPLGTRFRDVLYGWQTAGHILAYTLRLQAQAPRVASASTAMRILERRYIREGVAASPTSIKTAWLKYRPIAHTVPAMVQLYPLLKEVAQPLTALIAINEKDNFAVFANDPVSTIAADSEAYVARLGELSEHFLPRYLGLSEAYRKAGEAFFASGQEAHGHSLLNPETTWRVPESIELPRMLMELPPLDADELNVAFGK